MGMYKNSPKMQHIWHYGNALYTIQQYILGEHYYVTFLME